MKFHEKRAVGAMLASLVLIATSALAKDPVPIDLGDLGLDPAHPLDSGAADINISGRVVGWSKTSGGKTHGFLWPVNGAMSDLGTPDGQDSVASAINDSGVIVGYVGSMGVGGNGRPWVLRNGQYTWLPIPDGFTGAAIDVESSGVIAGCILGPSSKDPSPVTWNPFAVPAYKMRLLPGYTGVAGCLTHIDAAQIVSVNGLIWRANAFQFAGGCNKYSYCSIAGLDDSGSGRMAGNLSASPMYWPNLDFATGHYILPTQCSSSDGYAYDVNVMGQVIGRLEVCEMPGGHMFNRGFVWNTASETTWLDPLGSPGGDYCCAYAKSINDGGEVAGASTMSSGGLHATLWRVDWDVSVIPLPTCTPFPCRIPPEIWYIPNRFINDGIPSRPDFDATQLDPRFITLGDGQGHVAKVETNADGSPIARIEDVNDDGLRDLVVTFNTTQLIDEGALTPETGWLELSVEKPDGSLFQTRYPVWVRTHE